MSSFKIYNDIFFEPLYIKICIIFTYTFTLAKLEGSL